jgi:hypothetical protein
MIKIKSLARSIKILFCNHYFGPLKTFMRKEKDPDADPGGPKTYGTDPEHWRI